LNEGHLTLTIVRAKLTRGEEVLDILNINPIDPMARLSY